MSVHVARLLGPPGTGKTTRLSRSTRATVAERGTEAIRIASFSVTAAQEIASREGVKGVLPAGAVGTLHSHAFRAIEHPDVALDPKVVTDWNGSVGIDWRITGDGRQLGATDRSVGGGGDQLDTGDALLSMLDLLRARQTPGPEWPVPVRGFAKAWTAWKRERGCVDYTDMIVQAYQRAARGEPMPGNPSVLVVDEFQDMTPIECALALAWGKLLGEDGRLVFAGDDDQAIMDFRGGDPSMILDSDADDETLSLSHRVPMAVHRAAVEWIERASSRFPKAYAPRGRDEEHPERDPTPEHTRGWAYRVGFHLQDPRLVDAVTADLADGASVMVIASCGYMLTPLIKDLRARGLPFHNPYRPAEPAWNPLGKPGRGMSTVERIARYLVMDDRALGDASRLWTGDDIRAWADLVSVKAACMARGATRAVESLAAGTVPYEHVAALFRTDDAGQDALAAATEPDLEWLASAIAPSNVRKTAYPIQVARSQGPAALMEQPRLVLGTIHSVKGGQADVVYLAPDLSSAGMRQWQGLPETRDQTRRLMYVGMTRAYHRLVVLAPVSTSSVAPSELLPPDLEVRL